MRKIDVRVEFLKFFVAGLVLFGMAFGFREFGRRHNLLSAVMPVPDVFRDHAIAWRCATVVAASTVCSALVTVIAWLSRSDWQTVLELDMPIPPSRAGLHVGIGKIAIGALFVILGLGLPNPAVVLGGISLILLGLWWVVSYKRHQKRYEIDIARWNATHRVEREVSESSSPQ